MKIRIGNDVKMICTLKQGITTVDLSKVLNFIARISLNNGDDLDSTTTKINDYISPGEYTYNFFLYKAPYYLNVSGATIYIYFPASEQIYLGNYNLLVTYEMQSDTDSTVENNYTVDAENVFTLVKNTKASTDAGDMTITFDNTNLAFPYTFDLILS